MTRITFDERQDSFLAEQLKARWMAAAFVLYGLIGIGFLAINVPPFQVPDEPHHFLRAAQIADGAFVGTRFSKIEANGSSHVTAGGLSDSALLQAARPFKGIAFHPEIKATRTDWAPNVHWSGARSLVSFPNTVMYPPFFYLPSSAGVLAGRIAGMSIVRTLIVSRLLSGLMAIAIGALAIVIAGGAAPWIFTILTLPMSLSLMASTSQDGLMIACSGLAGALTARSLRWPTGQNRKLLAWNVVTLALVAMTRLPYGPLALLPLGLNKVEYRWRFLAVMAIVASVLTWWAVVRETTWVSFSSSIAGADPLAQLTRLWNDPLLLVTVITATLKEWRGYINMFIGDLGWLDTILPLNYYRVARIAVIVAAAAAMLGMRGDRVHCRNILPVAIGILLSAAAVFAVCYLTWPTPDGGAIEGIQGRYFLPIALAGAALLPALGSARMARVHNWLFVFVMAFPALSLAVVMRAVVLRYYLH